MRNLRIPGSILLAAVMLKSALYDVTGTPMDAPGVLATLALAVAGSFMLVYGGEDE